MRPEMPKSPPELVELFARVAPSGPNITVRKMFGYPACFVNGNMASGLHGASLIVRLAGEDRGRLLQEEGASLFEPMAGRPMKEYVVVPERFLADEAALEEWIANAVAYVSTLPPKDEKAGKGKRSR